MRIHILGICGTFMAGLALLARQAGHEVSGADENVYPPMSTMLEQQGIAVHLGYETTQLTDDIDCVVIGNAMRRGLPVVEAVLNRGLYYQSGPQWLADNILQDKWVIAIAGTHGKTTTAALTTWLLDSAGIDCGFLVGGQLENFGISARLGTAPFFVIEADEYDSAFFDKRSKFIHYHPRTLVINNLEYDHADIFPDLAAIERQFHHLIRTVPSQGLIIKPNNTDAIERVFTQGCWTPTQTVGLEQADWCISQVNKTCNHFTLKHDHQTIKITSPLLGQHNLLNTLAAMAAAHHCGVRLAAMSEGIASFKNVARRLEIKAKPNNITIIDDFAHHPTAIQATLTALRAKVGSARIIAVLEMGSNTMRAGVHGEQVHKALTEADLVLIKDQVKSANQQDIYSDTQQIIDKITQWAKPGDYVLIMSNKGFDNIHKRLTNCLESKIYETN